MQQTVIAIIEEMVFLNGMSFHDILNDIILMMMNLLAEPNLHKKILFSGSAERIITSPITITTKIENKVAAKTIFLLLKPKTNYKLFFLLKKQLRIGYYSSNNMNILQVYQ